MAAPAPQRQEPSDWALSGAIFAAVMMVLIGAFQFSVGLAALLNDEFFVVGRNYTYDIDITGWGWIHLILGVVVFLAGIALFSRKPWAAFTAIALATLSAFANFLFIPYYPFWAILVIAIDVWVIWSLTRPGAIDY